MKKGAVTLVLAMVLSLSTVGCGNSAETRTEEPPQTETQEEKQEETQYDEFEFFYSTDKLDLDNTIPCTLDDLSPNGPYCGDWNLTGSVDLYAERDGKACVIGYTKENIPVNVYNSSDEWIMLYFENEEQPNTFKFAKAEDFLANSDYDESKANYVTTEEPVESETEESDYVDSQVAYENILSVLDEVIDTEKVYTHEEFEELVIQIFDKSDYIKYNPDLNEDTVETKNMTWNLQGESIKDSFRMLFYQIYGAYGYCDEIAINVVETNGDEVEFCVRFTYN